MQASLMMNSIERGIKILPQLRTGTVYSKWQNVWMIKEILVLFWVRTCTVQECRKELWMPHHTVDARAGRKLVYWYRVVYWLTNSVLKVFTPTVPYREYNSGEVCPARVLALSWRKLQCVLRGRPVSGKTVPFLRRTDPPIGNLMRLRNIGPDGASDNGENRAL